MQNLKVSFIQSDLAWNDHKANLDKFGKIIQQINHTDLIVLPEMFNTGFVVQPEKVAEEAPADTLAWMKELAILKKCVIIGSMIVKVQENYFNRLYWVRPDSTHSHYDKRHLFSLGNEHLRFTAGQNPLVVDLNGWKIKPLICYDLRFPIWAKNKYANEQYEYDLLIYVANWPAARSHAWKSLLVARAIENQSYVVGVNRIGLDGHGTGHSGFSGIIEPKGEWISKQVENREHLETIELSKSELKNYRDKFTVGLDWDDFTINNQS